MNNNATNALLNRGPKQRQKESPSVCINTVFLCVLSTLPIHIKDWWFITVYPLSVLSSGQFPLGMKLHLSLTQGWRIKKSAVFMWTRTTHMAPRPNKRNGCITLTQLFMNVLKKILGVVNFLWSDSQKINKEKTRLRNREWRIRENLGVSIVMK